MATLGVPTLGKFCILKPSTHLTDCLSASSATPSMMMPYSFSKSNASAVYSAAHGFQSYPRLPKRREISCLSQKFPDLQSPHGASLDYHTIVFICTTPHIRKSSIEIHS